MIVINCSSILSFFLNFHSRFYFHCYFDSHRQLVLIQWGINSSFVKHTEGVLSEGWCIMACVKVSSKVPQSDSGGLRKIVLRINMFFSRACCLVFYFSYGWQHPSHHHQFEYLGSVFLCSYQNNMRAPAFLRELYRLGSMHQFGEKEWERKSERERENKITVWGDANDILSVSSPKLLPAHWQLMPGLNKKIRNLWLIAQSNHLSLFQLHG